MPNDYLIKELKVKYLKRYTVLEFPSYYYVKTSFCGKEKHFSIIFVRGILF